MDPALKRIGMVKAGRSIVAAEGAAGLLTGFGPTAVGYLAQGGAKFAGYEYWKCVGISETCYRVSESRELIECRETGRRSSRSVSFSALRLS